MPAIPVGKTVRVYSYMTDRTHLAGNFSLPCARNIPPQRPAHTGMTLRQQTKAHLKLQALFGVI